MSSPDRGFDAATLLSWLTEGGRPERLELPGLPPLALQAVLASCGYVATREAPGAYVRTAGIRTTPLPTPAVGLAGALAERVLEDLPGARPVDPIDVHATDDLVLVGDTTPTGRWVGRLVGAERSLRRDLVVAVREDGRWRRRHMPARVALDPSARREPDRGRAAGAGTDAALRLGAAGLPAPSPAARAWATRIGRGKVVALGGPRHHPELDRQVDRVRAALADLDVLLLHPSAFATAADLAVTAAVSAWSGVLPVTEDPERLAPYLSAAVRERLPAASQVPADVAGVERSLAQIVTALTRDHAADRLQRALTGLGGP